MYVLLLFVANWGDHKEVFKVRMQAFGGGFLIKQQAGYNGRENL